MDLIIGSESNKKKIKTLIMDFPPVQGPNTAYFERADYSREKTTTCVCEEQSFTTGV